MSLDDAIENIDIGGPRWCARRPRTGTTSRWWSIPPIIRPWPRRLRRAQARFARRRDGVWRARRCARRPPMTAQSQTTWAQVKDGAASAARRDLQPLAAARADAPLRRESASGRRALRRFLEIAEQLHGRELSFNNVFDISSAVNLMLDFTGYSDAVVAILKHNTPCGVGVGATLLRGLGESFRHRSRLAFRRDNHRQPPVEHAVRRAVDELFTEVLIGSAFAPGVLEFLRKKKNRRVMRFIPTPCGATNSTSARRRRPAGADTRSVASKIRARVRS